MITIYTYEEFCKYIKIENNVIYFSELTPGINRIDESLLIQGKKSKKTTFKFNSNYFASNLEIDLSKLDVDDIYKMAYNKYLYLLYAQLTGEKE